MKERRHQSLIIEKAVLQFQRKNRYEVGAIGVMPNMRLFSKGTKWYGALFYITMCAYAYVSLLLIRIFHSLRAAW